MSAGSDALEAGLYAQKAALEQVEPAMGPLFASIGQLAQLGDCAFVRTRFWQVHGAVCNLALPGLLWIAIGLAAGGVLSVVLGALLLMIAKRILIVEQRADAELMRVHPELGAASTSKPLSGPS